MKFLNRWIIEGTLTTQTPLRIGDGGEITAKDRKCCDYLIDKKADPEINPQINTVTVDHKGKPYIPASAIKGALRSWAENVLSPDEILSQDEIKIIFGSKKDANTPDDMIAGKVQFSNAFHDCEKNKFSTGDLDKFSQLPGWNEERLTAISAGIAVDRMKRTAADKKLFHQEFVPAGISFKFSICGSDHEINDEDEKALNNNPGLMTILRLLCGFNDKARPVCLGAETIGTDGSWGKLEWEATAVKLLSAEKAQDWLKKEGANKLEDEFEETPELRKLREDTKLNPIDLTQCLFDFDVTLQSSDDFLVNDPSKAKTKAEKEREEKDGKKGDKPNHSPLRTKDGRPLLPKSSVKGAVRSQAERILRTMTDTAGLTDKYPYKIACYPNDPSTACKPIKKIEEVKKELCLACQLFGASGWKSPVSFSDFTGTNSIFVEKVKVKDEESWVPKRREFVAIDRFTGGAAPGAKFNAEVAHAPILEGKISFDSFRLSDPWALGLLALTFRDLIEGDIRIGFGRAKGFGEISATVKGEKELTKK